MNFYEFNTEEDVTNYIKYLIDNDKMYHFDDLVSECFSDPKVIEKLSVENDRLRRFCGQNNICPFTKFFELMSTDKERCFKMYGQYTNPNE